MKKGTKEKKAGITPTAPERKGDDPLTNSFSWAPPLLPPFFKTSADTIDPIAHAFFRHYNAGDQTTALFIPKMKVSSPHTPSQIPQVDRTWPLQISTGHPSNPT